jgi:hypothetical protein
VSVRLTRPLWDAPELHTPWDDEDEADRRAREEEERLERWEARQDEGDDGTTNEGRRET